MKRIFRLPAALGLALLCLACVPAHPRSSAAAARAGTPGPASQLEDGLGALGFRPEVVPQVGHSGEVQDVLFAPDGSFVATSARDSLIKLWTADGRLLRTLRPAGLSPRIALSADGRLITAVSTPGYTELWKVTGERVARFPRLKVAAMGSVAFAPTDSYLVACSRASKVDGCMVFGLNGKPRVFLKNPAHGQDSVVQAAVSADAKTIYTLAARHLYRWNPRGELLGDQQICAGWARALAVSPDGSRLATACAGKHFRHYQTAIWSADGKLIKRFASHQTRSLAFSADGRWLLSGGERDGRLTFYDRDGKLFRSLKFGRYKSSSPAHFALSPDKRLLVVADHHFKPVRLGLWTATGKKIRRFNNDSNGILAMAVDRSSNLIVTTSSDRKIRYWSLDGRLLKTFAARSDYPSLLALAPNGRFLVTGNTTLTLWRGDGKLLARAKVNRRGGRSLAIGPEGKRIFTGDANGHLTIIPLAKGARPHRFTPHNGQSVDAIAVSPDGRLFATGSSWERFRIWDMAGHLQGDFRMPPSTKPPFSAAYALQFTPDGKRLVVATSRAGRQLAIYDLAARQLATIATGNHSLQGALAISANGRWVAASIGAAIGVWDLRSLKRVRLLRGHGARVHQLAFANGDRNLVSVDWSGAMRVWNLANGASMSMLAEGDDWIVYTDDGYFDASRHGGDMVALVDGMQAYGIDQLALHYNRPDIIYRRLGLKGPAALAHFRSCYLARLERLRPRAVGRKVSAPRVTLLGTQRQGKFVELDFSASDPVNGLKTIQVYVNDVPVYPGAGLAVQGKRLRRKVRVELSEGKNKMEVTARNALGIEALRVPAFAEYHAPVRRNLYFVGLGVSRYRDPRYALHFAAKDVLDLARVVKRYRGYFHRVHVLALTDAQVRRAALPRIRAFLTGARVDDTVVMLVSGHGGYELGARARYYFLPYDGDPRHLAATAISYHDLEGLLGGIAPRRKLLLLDSCDSGALDPEQAAALRLRAQGAGLLARTLAEGAPDGAAWRRPYLLARDRYIYNDLQRRTGSIVLSSSLGTELSLESPRWQNGVFTAALIAALTHRQTDSNGDGFISSEELETAVKTLVIAATDGLQHPTVDRDNSYQRFRLPVLKEDAGPGAVPLRLRKGSRD